MSRIAKDITLEKLSIDSTVILPKLNEVSEKPPIKGSIAYNLSDDPEGDIYYANGNEWLKINPDGFIGFPVTNPPPPALLPDGGIFIFNSSGPSWTVYSINGDFTVNNTGNTVINTVDGIPFGPFSAVSTNQVLGWNGSFWTNINPPATSPSGIAGGALTGMYPNPQLAPSGVIAGTYGSNNTVSTFTVNAAGQITAVSPIPISGLQPNAVSNVIVQRRINFPAGYSTQIFYQTLPNSWIQYKMYIAWIDSLGRGGTYEYSGGLRLYQGQIVPPLYFNGGWEAATNPTYGSTLQTVFGDTPEREDISDAFGQYAIWNQFSQAGANWSTTIRFEYINAAEIYVNANPYTAPTITPPLPPIFPESYFV